MRSTTPPEPAVADYTGIPTTMCPCGSEVFKTLVQIDPEDKEIGWYTLTAYCYMCGARCTLACPADMADDSSYVTV